MSTSYAGKLLVASPLLGGEAGADVFDHSVVLVLQHDPDDGAQGVILNRPADADIDAVLPGWQAVSTSPQTLFHGGPVEQNTAIGLVTVPGDDATPGIKRLFGGVGVVDLDAPPVLIAPEVAGLRIFVGYAGWSPGQLESELRRGDWFVVDAQPRDAFVDRPGLLWREVLRRQPPPLRHVAFFPADPDDN